MGLQLEYDADESRIVLTILRLADKAQTGSAIARRLNMSGSKRRNGKPWTQRQVTAIISRRLAYEEGRVRYGVANGYNKALVLRGGLNT